MSDWQVGDLARAVGVKREDWPGGTFAEGYADGKIYRVDSVNYIRGVVGLRFDDFPSPASHRHWHSASFRKILPDKHEDCEPEFVTLLRRSKQTAREERLSIETSRESGSCANNAPDTNQ